MPRPPRPRPLSLRLAPMAAVWLGAASGCFGTLPRPVEDQAELRSGEATAKAAQEAAEGAARDASGLGYLSNVPVAGGAPDRQRLGFDQPSAPLSQAPSPQPQVLRLTLADQVVALGPEGKPGEALDDEELAAMLARLRDLGRPLTLEVPARKVAEPPFVDLLRAVRDAGYGGNGIDLTIVPEATEPGPLEMPSGPPVTPGAGAP